MDTVRLGLRENASQFTLLVIVNAFVGAMVGLERSMLPLVAEREFQVSTRAALLAFIAVFGIAKAVTNYGAGRASDRFGRRHVLIAGWVAAVPVPFMLMWAPAWHWIVAANALLGVSQGLTWSTTIIMKIDLAGSARRGLAMGLNEFAGYIAVAGSALATGWIAAQYGLRPYPFCLGLGYVAAGLLLSIAVVRDTTSHVTLEAALAPLADRHVPSHREVFARTTWRNPTLASASQAGLVNNLNDGLAWGLFPLVFAASGLDLARIGILAAIYPATWGLGQLVTGAAADRVGRKPLIVWGMALQAVGIGMTAIATTFAGFAWGAVLLGAGTAMVYPALLAVVGDVAHPTWRASAVGVYRLWRDLGYAAGALIAGVAADLFGLRPALWIVAGLTLASGLVAAGRMKETLDHGV